MSDLTGNKFIHFVVENLPLYYNYQEARKANPIVEEIPDKKIKLPSLKKKEKVKSLDQVYTDEIYEKLIRFTDMTFLTPKGGEEFRTSFSTMWQFCQFVRFAEKTYFYHNTPDTELYVDSDMNELVKRNFLIRHEEVNIICSMEKVKDTINNRYLNVLKITIQRNYGKQMKNEFTIVDDFIKTKDESDEILIYNTYRLILEKMKEVFRLIMIKFIYDEY